MNKTQEKRTVLIDGRYLEQHMTGVQRFASEIVKRLPCAKDLTFRVAVPAGVKELPPPLENVTFVRVGKRGGTLWEQVDLARYAKKQNLPLLCLCNAAPMRVRAFVVLHDLVWLDVPKSYVVRGWRMKSKLMIKSVLKKNAGLFTVSNFSAERIRARFPKANPVVLGNGWEHVKDWKEEAVSGLPEEFYLSVGSVLPHKNFLYILRLAGLLPDKNFVIVGEKNPIFQEYLEENKVKNCFFTGYLNDGNLKWLYARCKGFLLPSRYEGFGIPPLEAIACGSKKLFLSDIPVFREVYGDAANYFDPENPSASFSLDGGKEIPFSEREALLSAYSWDKFARLLAEHLERALLGEGE